MKELKKIIAVFVIFVVGFQLYSRNKSIQENNDFGEKDHPYLIHFLETNKNYDLLMAKSEDVNDDGKKDLLVIYHPQEEEKNYAVVLLNKDNTQYQATEKFLAPRENVDIQFKNIDEKEPIEFIISGSKDGNYGYAIYRMQADMTVRDLFSEDMDNCC
ncbi:MAG: Cys-Cys-COOH (seleno)protein SaoC [Peptostreptococcaceae bacterium]|nr:Cys-Cys-COOH (seleno)protein SaoC [Peptostreptococcaceae bacterium]